MGYGVRDLGLAGLSSTTRMNAWPLFLCVSVFRVYDLMCRVCGFGVNVQGVWVWGLGRSLIFRRLGF
jgi:hypothetical protein